MVFHDRQHYLVAYVHQRTIGALPRLTRLAVVPVKITSALSSAPRYRPAVRVWPPAGGGLRATVWHAAVYVGFRVEITVAYGVDHRRWCVRVVAVLSRYISSGDRRFCGRGRETVGVCRRCRVLSWGRCRFGLFRRAVAAYGCKCLKRISVRCRRRSARPGMLTESITSDMNACMSIMRASRSGIMRVRM